jgi:hypothetical protein
MKLKPEKLLEELKALAESIGVQVIIDKGNFAGGYCTVYEQRKIVLNRLLPPEAKASKIAQSLVQFSLDEVFIKPALREFIESEHGRATAQRPQNGLPMPSLESLSA